MGKKSLRKSEIRDLNEKIQYLEISKKEKVEIDGEIIFIDGKPSFFYYENKIFPHLKLLLEKDLIKNVVVDMKSIKFLINGADIMRPGIVKIDEQIEKDEIVAVRDETHNKAICVCTAMYSGKEIQEMEKGKVLKNIHYIGDNYWNST